MALIATVAQGREVQSDEPKKKLYSVSSEWTAPAEFVRQAQKLMFP